MENNITAGECVYRRGREKTQNGIETKAEVADNLSLTWSRQGENPERD